MTAARTKRTGQGAARIAVLVAVLFLSIGMAGMSTAHAAERVHLRIEGAKHTLWAGPVMVGTHTLVDSDGGTHTLTGKALCTVDEAARLRAFSYTLRDTSLGLYLAEMAGESEITAPPYPGWLYRVNGAFPLTGDGVFVGAGEYDVKEGDEVLWYYGTFDTSPVAVELASRAIPIRGTLTVRVKQLDAFGAPSELGGAIVHIGSTVATADAAGEVTQTMTAPGTFGVRAEKEGFVRSGITYVRVGHRSAIASFDASPRRIHYGERVALTGRLFAGGKRGAGEVVRIQARTPGSGGWRTVLLARTDRYGRLYATRLPARTTLYRAFWPGDATRLPAFSGAVLVRVHR